MGRKVFVTYKYADKLVAPLNGSSQSTVRDYVDILETKFEGFETYSWHGESQNQDLSNLQEETIRSYLSDKMFDTTVTICFVSKGMREFRPESDQWIPWELSFSLKKTTRSDKTSQRNGVLLVVLPDENNSYEYFIKKTSCVTILQLPNQFGIIQRHFFNKVGVVGESHPGCIYTHYSKTDSYFIYTEWQEFITGDRAVELIEQAYERAQICDQYIVKPELR